MIDLQNDKFLGESFEYWRELKKRADSLDVRDLIRDLTEVGGKLSQLERLIEKMNEVKNSKL